MSLSTLKDPRNVFSFPWKNSDVVLVVGEEEFHVHRWILSMQSPVFEKMLNGALKEATQEKITIKEKTADDMLQFLKLLYPANMIKGPLISFTTENTLRMLAIADEYQAENVTTQCFDQIKIEGENVFQIFPYADKYNRVVRHKCINAMARNVTTDTLESELDDLDETVIKEVLLSKCRLLESITNEGRKILTQLLKKVIDKTSDMKSSVNLGLGCGHTIDVLSFHEARQCENCLRQYKKHFAGRLLGSLEFRICFEDYGMENENPTGEQLFQLLMDLDDVQHAYQAE